MPLPPSRVGGDSTWGRYARYPDAAFGFRVEHASIPYRHEFFTWINRTYRIIPGSRLSRNPGHPQCFEPASRAAASRPVYPIYPVYPCFLRKEYLIPGRQPGIEWSREAAAAGSRGRKPMDTNVPPPEPRRRRQQLSMEFALKPAAARPPQFAPEDSPKQKTPGASTGDSNRAAKRRQRVAVGVSPWKTDPNPEPRRRRQQSSAVFDLKPAGPRPPQSAP